MPSEKPWAFDTSLQPRAGELAFELDDALDAVVMVHAEIPEDAFTANVLGTSRDGSGVVIGEDGLLLTIGYLVTEAESIWLTTNSGKVVAGHALLYDQITGLGLVQALGDLDVPALPRGSAANVSRGDDVTVIGQGGGDHALKANLADKREFAGYWEYLLEEALFTSPAHPQWGGSALVDERGELIGIGSLLVQEVTGDKSVQGNMFVPVDIFEPILAAVLAGKPLERKPRPWLGMYTQESERSLIVSGLAPGGPGEKAGVQVGDLVLGVTGERTANLPEFLRRVWRLGGPGVDVPLMLARQGDVLRVSVRAADRNDFLKKPRLH